MAEVFYLSLLSRDLGFFSESDADAIMKEADEIARMLYALRMKVEAGA